MAIDLREERLHELFTLIKQYIFKFESSCQRTSGNRKPRKMIFIFKTSELVQSKQVQVIYYFC